LAGNWTSLKFVICYLEFALLALDLALVLETPFAFVFEFEFDLG